MSILCKLFGHAWRYYIRNANPNQNIRACAHCNIIQDYKLILHHMAWVNLVQRSKKGAKIWMSEKNVKEN